LRKGGRIILPFSLAYLFTFDYLQGMKHPRTRLTEVMTIRLSPEERNFVREKGREYRSDAEFVRELIQWYEKSHG